MEKRRNETRQLIGYVSYENDLDPWLTLKQNISFNANLYSVENRIFKERLKTYSSALNLDPFLNEYAFRVSGGVQKKSNVSEGAYS